MLWRRTLRPRRQGSWAGTAPVPPPSTWRDRRTPQPEALLVRSKPSCVSFDQPPWCRDLRAVKGSLRRFAPLTERGVADLDG